MPNTIVSEPFVPPGGPPQKPLNRDLFERLGEETIRRLLRLHYARLEQSAVRGLFPEDMEAASQKAADFFIQVMGGPPHYAQKYGPPRMRMRHMPFTITKRARDIWLECFRAALDELPFPTELRPEFEEFLDSFSLWMVNTQ